MHPCHSPVRSWPRRVHLRLAVPATRAGTSGLHLLLRATQFPHTMRAVLNQTCRVVPAAALALPDDARSPLDPGQVVSGSPHVHALPLAEDEAVEVGIWQHTVGVSTDVEADEVFIVLAGRATIEVVDGPTLEVGPGDIGFLTAGARTVWTVHEDLRKVYVVRP